MGPYAIPIAIAAGVAQTGLSIRSQQQAAKAQAEYQQAASKAEAQRARQQLSAMRVNQAQERIAAAKRIQAAARASQEARATAVVSAGEAGVAGISVDALENDIIREKAEFRFGVQQQLEFNDIARNFAFKDAQMSSTMNQIRINQPIAPVDYAGAALGGLSTGLSIYSVGGGGGGGGGKKP